MSTLSREKAESRPVKIAGYAIVSDDDRIAGLDGLVPPSLRNEKDWEYYQGALARSDLIVFGRRSHEAEPNVRGDLRLVVSREAAPASSSVRMLGGGVRRASSGRRS